MHYHQPLFRPPSEAESLILQVTLGCSHNRCTFCGMYQTKQYTVRREDEVAADIEAARRMVGPDVRRLFLADGDAFGLSPPRLHRLLDRVHRAFPSLSRVASYANARDVLRKTDDELADLARRKLRLLYIGLESGDPQTLSRVQKGGTVDELVEAAVRAREAGIAVSCMVLIGLAGRQRSAEHARASAAAINRMAPRYTALLTYTPVPGTPLTDELGEGTFELPTPEGSLEEIRAFVSDLSCSTYFTCTHASNYLPLRGTMPAAKPQLLAMLDAAIDGKVALKPEFLRGL